MRDIFPTEPCANVIEPTPNSNRAVPQRANGSNGTNRTQTRRAPDHNSLRAESRVQENFSQYGINWIEFIRIYCL